MFKLKLMKGILFGTCISLLSSGAAFAATKGEAPTVQAAAVSAEDKGEGQSGNSGGQDSRTDEGLLEKQKEIDQYVFTDNIDKLKEMGFEAVYTGQAEGYVEIGITPYKEEYADFLYEQFGKETVKVVEGEKAMLYTTMETSAPDASVSADAGNDDVAVEDSSKMAESGLAADVNQEDASDNDNLVKTSGIAPDELGNADSNNSIMFIMVTLIGAAILISGIVMIDRKKQIKK